MKIKNNTQEIQVPRKYIVYYLTDNEGEVVYVGKSNSSMFNRLGSHTYQKQFERVFYREFETEEEMEKVEVEEILNYRPKYNGIVEKPHLVGYMNRKQVRQFMRENKIKIYNFTAFVEKENIDVVSMKNATYYNDSIKTILIEKGKRSR